MAKIAKSKVFSFTPSTANDQPASAQIPMQSSEKKSEGRTLISFLACVHWLPSSRRNSSLRFSRMARSYSSAVLKVGFASLVGV